MSRNQSQVPSAQRRLRIVVGRFGEVILRGLTAVLAEDSDTQLIAAGVNGLELERITASEAPQVVLIAHDLRQASIQRLLAVAPNAALVVFGPQSSYPDGRHPDGVTHLPTDISAKELFVALRKAARLTSKPTLTGRERQVLALISEGLTHAEIAIELGIKEETARSHSANIRQKLGVPSNRQLFGLKLA